LNRVDKIVMGGLVIFIIVLAFIVCDPRGNKVYGQESLEVTTTMYTLRGTMRWGREVYDGAAGCSSNIPPGSILYFPANGWRVVCEDTGGGLLTTGYRGCCQGWVDVWTPSHSNAVNFGRRTMVAQVERWGW
jgi:3D (Asp-Asp-Asp) domain-containing protein